ncbi:MAG TPA: tetratricopeptide repeat protein [Cyclobacteriaceae bacterium]|jgi:two-component sensor histidine kinase|nr:tetratricopeptide repeat protein [Cyclobacteriaceae bacterium]
MKLYLLLAFTFCSSLCGKAQSRTDSLKNLLHVFEREGDKVKIAGCLSHIGFEFLSASQFDSALYYYYRSIHISTSDKILTASSLDCMGVAYNFKGFPDSSIVYYNRALSYYAQLRDTAHAIVIENNLAIIYKNKGLYEDALESAFGALTKLEKLPPDRTLASCYNTIGGVYEQIKDYSNSILYYKKALTVRKSIDYKKGIGQSYNNLGEVYSRLKRYDSALFYLSRSLEVKKEIQDQKAIGTTLNFIGEVYMALGQLSDAEPYFKQSLAIKKESGERVGEAEVLNNLGKLKLKTNDLENAEALLNEAEVLIREAGALDDLRINLELKVLLFTKKPNPVKALKYAEELLLVKDSLLSREKTQSLMTMQARYESEKKEQQINSLEQASIVQKAEIETKRLWIQSLIVTAGLIFVIGVLLFYSYRLSQRSKRKVEILLKELHHRVKNNLQILSSVLSLQSQYVKDDDTVQVIKSSEGRVNTMALIHKKLYSDDRNRTINMQEYIHELCGYLLHTYGYTNDTITLDIQINNVTVDVDKAIPIGLILNELISNALKYAYIKQDQPQLKIGLTLHHQHELVLELRDNGIGISENKREQTSQSFGLKMVDTLIKELKGKLLLINDSGTVYFIHIPLL